MLTVNMGPGPDSAQVRVDTGQSVRQILGVGIPPATTLPDRSHAMPLALTRLSTLSLERRLDAIDNGAHPDSPDEVRAIVAELRERRRDAGPTVGHASAA